LSGRSRLTVKTGDWATLAAHALPVRLRVFVQEQQVPVEMEVDACDAWALHAVVFSEEGSALATGRLVSEKSGGDLKPTLSETAKSLGRIGRVAVLASHRGQGLGVLVMKTLIQAANDQRLGRLTLHAQQQAASFYEIFGFRVVGEVFEEAGIPHVEMWL